MKTLFLARHAKSDWKQPALRDHDRPLNARGRRDAPRMAAHLAARYAPPQRILCSTALRASTTAQRLGEALGGATIDYRAELYLAEPATLLAQLHDLPDALERVMLVGHNPGMTALVNALADAGLDNLPTCGVARIGFDVDSWARLAPGAGRLLSLDVPKALPDD